MRTLTGVDLPWGSPGGSVELLADLYLGPDAPIDADVFMLAAADGGPAAGRGAAPVLVPTRAKCLDGPAFWSYVEALAGDLRQRFTPGDYGAIHLQHLAFGATPALLSAFPAVPALALVHGTDLLFANEHPTQAAVLRQAVAAAHTIVVPTEAMIAKLRRLAPVPPGRIVHVPWGVPDHLLRVRPSVADRAGETFRLLYAGRLTPEKGVDGLVEVVAGWPDVTLSLAAPRHEYKDLRQRCGDDGIRYLGWLTRSQLWREFAAHDLLVVPSTQLEAFGLVAVEAQACGLPVLYQAVPGLGEVLGDSAVAVDPSHGAIGLAKAIAGVRGDAAALADLRRAGYRNAARFPLSRTARQLRLLSEQMKG